MRRSLTYMMCTTYQCVVRLYDAGSSCKPITAENAGYRFYRDRDLDRDF